MLSYSSVVVLVVFLQEATSMDKLGFPILLLLAAILMDVLGLLIQCSLLSSGSYIYGGA